MRNIKLQVPRKLQDHYVGPFKILEHIGKTAYQLDLSASKRQVLQGLHDVFHISLPQHYRTNGLDYKALQVEIDGEEQCKVEAIRKHWVICRKT